VGCGGWSALVRTGGSSRYAATGPHLVVVGESPTSNHTPQVEYDREIRQLGRKTGDLPALADLLVRTVAEGGSVSFMHPLAVERATRFWDQSLAAADRGERVILGAHSAGRLVGTVTLLVDCPENQPHRAEIAKLMTRPDHRGRGVGRALVREAEHIAAARGRTLLTLDTAEEEGAAAFYERLGYTRVGAIPDYALKPHGGLTATIIFFKKLGVGR
jgi:ribosomal protein S18 acetylase RimI-like enzyme